ncbi:gamma-glutamyltransferase [Klenkia brasiliensis]|uniref:Gamma-glutamyltranspeptidase / glutathione hydrolase n=1 Tax=Klenkia brasiliensis TaxID=333142 RepID=A0A1G7SVU6_9ACTN|nr:gamma-glutamyltransferase [Klenkia brasiliensis]SDG26914.1 gamma-glutamyltranspeptidase / glutathione hydrolase [Klenkia brasiliensis]
MESTLLARRAVASGTLGAVAAGSRTAAAIGSAALLDGGSAVDAAVAAALAETVLLPPKCGLGGDLVALVLPAGAAAPESLVAIGPAAAGLAGLAERQGWEVAPTGGAAVGVPGAPAGYAALADLGRLGRGRLAAPAIALAERGVPWSAVCARLAAEADDLLVRHAPGGSVFRPAAARLPVGTRVRLPGLARLLRGFVEEGAGVFAGELGAEVLATVAEHGGVLTAADLASARASWSPPTSARVAGRTVWATPDPTHGPALLGALAAVAGPPGPAEVLAALERMNGGRRPALTGGTSAVAAVDAEGGAVVVVHSNSWPQFGSGLVVPGLDLVLGNRAGRGFTFEPGHPNAPVAGRRPRTTLHAWAAADRSGRPAVLGATPGGEQQVPWNAQLLGRLLASGAPDGDPVAADLAVGAALAAPRWALDADGRVTGETAGAPPWSARSSHVVVRVGGDVVSAAADPRLDGAAVAV